MSAKKAKPAPKPRRAENQDAANMMKQIAAINRAGEEAGHALWELQNAAQSGEHPRAGFAASVLLNVLTLALKNFENHVTHSPEQFTALAGGLHSFPGLYHAHSNRRDETAAAMKAINLAGESGLNFIGKPWSLSLPAKRIVEELYKFAERHRRGNGRVIIRTINGAAFTTTQQRELDDIIETKVRVLPPLSRNADALRLWRAAGRALVPILYGKEFHTHSKFKKFHNRTETKKLADDGGGYNAVRRRVQDAIEKAWNDVAKVMSDG